MKKLLGIVLAGGKSERLKGKLLLKDKNGLPFIDGAFRIFDRCSSIERSIAIVHKEDEPLRKYLDSKGRDYILEGRRSGVLGALSIFEEPIVVLCGDNVYPSEFVDIVNDMASMPPAVVAACVTPVKAQETDIKDLDAWSMGDGFVRAREALYPITQYLLTPWRIPPGTILPGMTSVPNYFNSHPTVKVPFVGAGWHDIGTPQSYEDYLNDRDYN